MPSLIEDYINYQIDYQSKYGNDTIVFMEVGSFYELYEVNGMGKASVVSSLLNILLTKKNKNIEEVSIKNPLMAGIPTIALSKHLSVLAALNRFTIVIVSQVSEPPNVRREVSEVLSPGTCVSPNSSHNTYIFSCFFEKYNDKHLGLGISIMDVSTGTLKLLSSLSTLDNPQKPLHDLARFLVEYQPTEIVFSYLDFNSSEFENILQIVNPACNYIFQTPPPGRLKIDFINQVFSEVFSNNSMLSGVEWLGLDNNLIASYSLIMLIDFLRDHNPLILNNIPRPELLSESNSLILTNNSLYQLNVINPNIHREDQGSLFSFYDRTMTAMGSRLLKNRLTKPTNDSSELVKRYDLVDFFLINDAFTLFRTSLSGTLDLERLFRKMGIGNAEPYDLFSFHHSLLNINQSLVLIVGTNMIFNSTLRTKLFSIVREIEDVFIVNNLSHYNPQSPTSPIFQAGIHADIDSLTNYISHLGVKIVEINESFNKTHGVNASIESTDKDGHFISITNTQLKKVTLEKEGFVIRRYSSRSKIFSDQLSTISNNLSAYLHKANLLTKHHFGKQLNEIYTTHNHTINQIISDTAQADVACNTAFMTSKYNYFRPRIVKGKNSHLECLNLRHPIAETLIKTDYVANDIVLNDGHLGKLIFGVNATGKSTLLKATGLSVIMAQAGLYVSCKMKYSPFNSLFTRITSGDNIFRNQSTFTVEMMELKTILSNADSNSLVLADELSHGTETNSGVAILSASIDSLTNLKSKFIFTTHLHQVTNISIIKSNHHLDLEHLTVEFDTLMNRFVYNRILSPGSGDSFYGLVVARGMGLTDAFISMAHDVLLEISPSIKNTDLLLNAKPSRYNQLKLRINCEICGGVSLDIHHIEHQSSSNDANFTTGGHVNRESNLISVCKSCHTDIHNNIIFDIRYVLTTRGIVLAFNRTDQ